MIKHLIPSGIIKLKSMLKKMKKTLKAPGYMRRKRNEESLKTRLQTMTPLYLMAYQLEAGTPSKEQPIIGSSPN